jgi:beta propeller repeat protein
MKYAMTTLRLILPLGLMLCLTGCGDDGASLPEPDATADASIGDDGEAPEPSDVGEVAEGDVTEEEPGEDVTEEAGDSEGVTDDVAAPADDVEQGDTSVAPSDIQGPGPEDITEPIDPSGSFEIGQDACCLSVSGDRAVWAEGGDLWVHTLSTGISVVLIDHEATQTDPALYGDVVVWADDRGGDLDLWMMDLTVGTPSLLFGAPGDQDAPSIDGTRVVFVHRAVAPHSDKEADIWMIDLEDTSTAAALTSDTSEQSYPHIHGDRVIWTDFRNDPQGVYTDFADPLENNGDIYGYDLTLDEEFVVTNDPSKQLRPTIEGEDVVWLDWRGINPEPKYSEFQVYVRTVSPEMVLGPERLIAWSSWETPGLWQRPSVLNGVVAWIGMPEEGEFKTGVFATNLADADVSPTMIAGSAGTLEAVSLTPQGVIWLGAGTLGLDALELSSGQ